MPKDDDRYAARGIAERERLIEKGIAPATKEVPTPQPRDGSGLGGEPTKSSDDQE